MSRSKVLLCVLALPAAAPTAAQLLLLPPLPSTLSWPYILLTAVLLLCVLAPPAAAAVLPTAAAAAVTARLCLSPRSWQPHILLTAVLLLCVLASPAAASAAPQLLPRRLHRANHSRPPLPLWLSSAGICCSSSCSNPSSRKHSEDTRVLSNFDFAAAALHYKLHMLTTPYMMIMLSAAPAAPAMSASRQQ
jgi:hypothetical protein